MSWENFAKNFATGYAIGDRAANTYFRNQFAATLKRYEDLINDVASGAVATTEGDPYEELAQTRTKLTELGVRSGMTPDEVKDFSLYVGAAESRLQTQLGKRVLGAWGTPAALDAAKKFLRMMGPSSEVSATFNDKGELVGSITDEQHGTSVFAMTQESVQKMIELAAMDPASFAANNRESLKLDLEVMRTQAAVGHTLAQTKAIEGAEQRAKEAFPVELDARRASTEAVRGAESRAQATFPATLRTANARAAQEETTAAALPTGLAAETKLKEAQAKAAEASAELALFRAAQAIEGGATIDAKVVQDEIKEFNKHVSAPEYDYVVMNRPDTDSFKQIYKRDPTRATALMARIAMIELAAGRPRAIAELEAMAVEEVRRRSASRSE